MFHSPTCVILFASCFIQICKALCYCVLNCALKGAMYIKLIIIIIIVNVIIIIITFYYIPCFAFVVLSILSSETYFIYFSPVF